MLRAPSVSRVLTCCSSCGVVARSSSPLTESLWPCSGKRLVLDLELGRLTIATCLSWGR
jgi:hypothetical protein